jgi:hypothetical protein
MDDQSTEVDADTLATLLARVAQTTTGVVITLMGETTGSTPSLPIDSLRALADEFDWVSSVIRRQVDSAQPDGRA